MSFFAQVSCEKDGALGRRTNLICEYRLHEYHIKIRLRGVAEYEAFTGSSAIDRSKNPPNNLFV